MLADAAIAAGIYPSHNRRAVNKQWYGCTATEDLCLSARVSEQRDTAGDRVPSVETTARHHDRPGTIFSNSSTELIFGLD